MYSYNYVKDASGKITDINVNGKPVKRGFMRGMRKAQETKFWQEIQNTRNFTNPYSGVSVQLNPLEGTIYNWCIAWYARYERGIETGVPVQTYDDMKYFLLELNSQAYMDLID